VFDLLQCSCQHSCKGAACWACLTLRCLLICLSSPLRPIIVCDLLLVLGRRGHSKKLPLLRHFAGVHAAGHAHLVGDALCLLCCFCPSNEQGCAQIQCSQLCFKVAALTACCSCCIALCLPPMPRVLQLHGGTPDRLLFPACFCLRHSVHQGPHQSHHLTHARL
jgi:hypothetical protein